MSAAFQYHLKRRVFFRSLQSAGRRIGAQNTSSADRPTMRYLLSRAACRITQTTKANPDILGLAFVPLKIVTNEKKG
jgi:hypothetical protein